MIVARSGGRERCPTCRRDGDLWTEILQARRAAHAKHGDQSIEMLPPDRIGAWLAILVEEIGELARSLTYDGNGDPRAELVDVLAVASAWVAAMDQRPPLTEAAGT